MLKTLLFASLGVAIVLTLPACATKTEVVALQPASRPVARPAVVTRTQTVNVKKKAPAPSPWATDVVSSYEEKP